jgi:hypothetical protein
MKDKKELRELIARTIKAADNSYFWEDYMKQADAVVRGLQAKGLAIVPIAPSLPMVQAGVHAVVIGKTKPQDLATQIYEGMIKAYQK